MLIDVVLMKDLKTQPLLQSKPLSKEEPRWFISSSEGAKTSFQCSTSTKLLWDLAVMADLPMNSISKRCHPCILRSQWTTSGRMMRSVPSIQDKRMKQRESVLLRSFFKLWKRMIQIGKSGLILSSWDSTNSYFKQPLTYCWSIRDKTGLYGLIQE